MSAVLIFAKTVMLVAFALALFMAVAFALGVDPMPVVGAERCTTTSPHMCLFTIV